MRSRIIKKMANDSLTMKWMSSRSLKHVHDEEFWFKVLKNQMEARSKKRKRGVFPAACCRLLLLLFTSFFLLCLHGV
jgi:hypothetical protein